MPRSVRPRPRFIRAVRPVIELYTSYFRSEVRGFERLPPRGPFLVVGNHSGGQMPPDLPVLLTAWWRERGEDEPVYALFHSFFLALPGVGPIMERAGAVEAGNVEAEQVLRGGAVLIDYPGGDYDVFRPWSERNRIGFGDRLGFVRLALRTQVPVVPAVSVGAHETVIVLARGARIAKRLGLDRRFRIKVMPLVFGPPFGIVPGGIPTWPLPPRSRSSCANPSTGRLGTVPRRLTTTSSSVPAMRRSRRPCRRRSTSSRPSGAIRSSDSSTASTEARPGDGTWSPDLNPMGQGPVTRHEAARRPHRAGSRSSRRSCCHPPAGCHRVSCSGRLLPRRGS